MPIPDEVQRFILISIPSVPHLEAALLFHADPQSPPRRAAELAQALYVTERRAAELLSYLCGIGLLAQEGDEHYAYRPRDAAMQALMDRLAQAWRSDMISVTHLIHDSTQKSAHRFADAFRFGKKES